MRREEGRIPHNIIIVKREKNVGHILSCHGDGPDSPTLPLQGVASPSACAKCLALRLGNSFVKMSTTISSVGQ